MTQQHHQPVPDRSRASVLPPTWRSVRRASVPNPPVVKGRTARDYEFQILTLPKGVSIGEARQALSDEAEYGRWELARMQKFYGGGKKVWLRRRIMRMVS